ncbi:MAG TPA: DUF4287 domain-containing protein [Thermoanaerobaculia bacterium]|jgi:hypothetical protein|nr:DUF4287 domain-containing protein [Thermoanaerobaculia bacterium]
MDVATAVQNQIANLEAKTGKSFAEWLAIGRSCGFAKHGEIVKFLKETYGIGHGYANLIALRSLEADAPPPAASADLADDLYTGPKAALRPIHDAVMTALRGFGNDLEEAPKKGYLSLRRKKQLGLIQPAAATRVDLGLVLKGVEPAGRLEAAGSWNGMMSHRVRLSAPTEVDAELIGWLRQAFDAAG